MPAHELDALRRDAVSVLISWLAIAAGAAAIAFILWMALRPFRLFPPQRLRATAWTGPLVGVAFVLFILARDLVLPYIDREALARFLSAGDLSDKSARLVAYCAAETLALPLQLAAWTGLAVLAGQPLVLGWNARRLAGDFVAGFRTWLVLTPAVYAVSFAAEVIYRLVTGVPPQGHPILQTFQEGPVPLSVFVLLLVQAVVVAPIKEEVFFRGIVQPWLAAKPWGGDVALWLAAVIGVAVRSPAVGQAGDLQSIVSTAAPALLVFATLPAYWHIDKWPLTRWLPVRDPAAHTQIARAIIGTSLLFANFHANVWPTPIPLFVLALGLGWLAFRTQSVMAPIVVHMLFNAIVFAALVFAPTPPPVAPG